MLVFSEEVDLDLELELEVEVEMEMELFCDCVSLSSKGFVVASIEFPIGANLLITFSVIWEVSARH
jgi:hypothetical protein